MTKLPRYLLLFLLLILSGVQGVVAEPITIGATATLRSELLDEERGLMIYLPPRYEQSDERYPVIYLLDAGTRFHHTSGTAASLARIGHVPEMIVVGITNTDRTRDLTPPWTRLEEAPDWAANAIAAGGGADRFLSFLKEELIPHVDREYRTVPYRILVGHSFGGLFAIHSLVHAPELLDATLAISPSLQWDGGLLVEQAADLFASRPGLEARLYVTVADEGDELLNGYRALEDLLSYRAPEGLRWKMEVFSAEDHGSVPIPSVHSGLREFYRRWPVPEFVFEEGLAGIDGHYARLTREYGYEIQAPEATLNTLGYAALALGKQDEALEIFRANVERFPDSANVYDSLGEALDAAGELHEAREQFERAVRLGEQSSDPNTSAYRGHLDAALEKIASAEE